MGTLPTHWAESLYRWCSPAMLSSFAGNRLRAGPNRAGPLMWRVRAGCRAGGEHDDRLTFPHLLRAKARPHKALPMWRSPRESSDDRADSGPALLALGGWRLIHAVLADRPPLLLAMLLGFAETNGSTRPTTGPAVIPRQLSFVS